MTTNEAAAVHLEAVSDTPTETIPETDPPTESRAIDAETIASGTGDPGTTDLAPGPPRRSRMRRFLRGVLALAVVAAIALAAVVGWPVLDEQVFQRVETTAADTAALQAGAVANEQRIADLDAELLSLREAVAQTAEEQASTRDDLDALGPVVDDLIPAVSSQEDQLAELSAAQEAFGDEVAGGAVAVERRMEIFQALTSLSRARLYLFEANYGLAREDVVSARAAIFGLASDNEDPVLVEVVNRLDRAISALPDRPVVANGDLDIAWQLLIDGAPIDGTAPATLPDQDPNAAGPDALDPSAASPDGSGTPVDPGE